MSGPQLLSLPGSFLTPPATLPVAIDYPAALALRQMSMVHDELPKYLLVTLKQRTEKAARTAGRTPAGQ